DEIRKQIEAVQKKLRAERDHLGKVRLQAKTKAQLAPEQATSLRAVRKENRSIRSDLRRLAHEAAAMLLVSERAQDIADSEMTRSEEALGRAQDKKADDTQRADELQKA